MLENAKNAIMAVGVGVLILALVAYLAYMVGLILVLKRMHRLSWLAFVPLVNYYAQVKGIGAPKNWFVMSLPPYIGAVYVAAVAIRLGKVFGRGPAFSLAWLTFAAPVGMFMLAFGKNNPDLAVIESPAELVDLKKLNQSLKSKKAEH